MSFDTPGSHVNRKVEANFELSVPRKKLKMGLTTPFKKLALDGDLQERRKNADYGATVKLTVDDKNYNLDGDLKVCCLQI